MPDSLDLFEVLEVTGMSSAAHKDIPSHVCLNSGNSQRAVGETFGDRGKGLYAVRFAPDLLATPWQQYYCFTKLRQRVPPPTCFSWRHTHKPALANSSRLMHIFC